MYKPSTIARDQGIDVLQLDRPEPRAVLAGRNRRVQLQRGRDPGQRRADRPGLLQDARQEVDLFGGSIGNFEGNVPSSDGGCVDNPFRWCDNLGNNDPEVLTFMSKAFANMVVQMAFDTKVMSASNNAVYQQEAPGVRVQ